MSAMDVRNPGSVSRLAGPDAVSDEPSTVNPQPPEPLSALEARYNAVKSRIAAAAARARRDPSRIILVAVTKFASADQIRHLVNLGHRDFGENYVQTLLQHAPIIEEFLARGRTLPNARQHADVQAAVLGLPSRTGAGATGATSSTPPGTDRVRWHMIGHMQRNKVKKALDYCRLVHTVDSLRLAEEIQAAAQKREQPVDVLVQVNCSGEEQKFGVPPPAALHLCEQIETMLTVRVRGLMTMAAHDDNPEAARHAFRMCRELFEDIRKTGIGDGQFNLLSMGMSGDFEVAIEEGANLVRVGSAIFGTTPAGPEPAAEPQDSDDEADTDPADAGKP